MYVPVDFVILRAKLGEHGDYKVGACERAELSEPLLVRFFLNHDGNACKGRKHLRARQRPPAACTRRKGYTSVSDVKTVGEEQSENAWRTL